MATSYRASNRIAHHVATEQTTLVECLKNHFSLDDTTAKDLISLGAIYSGQRRVFENIKMGKGAYIRIHLKPKRFNVKSIDWKSRVIAETKDFVVVNKPAGIPIHATLDNHEENVLTQMRHALGGNLYVTQRLDVPVSGLVVLAKTKEFQAEFNKLLHDRKVTKKYTALTETTVPVGHHVHYMEPSERAPKRMSMEAKEKWQVCELIVEESNPINFNEKPCFENKIQLITGRTHQIRAQLALMGAPLLNDLEYGSRFKFASEEAIGLSCSEVAWGSYSYTGLTGSLALHSANFLART